MGLLLGNPLSRSRVLGAKAASLLVLAALGIGILWLSAIYSPEILGVDVGAYDTGAMMTHLFVNTLFYGFLALAVGAWTGNGSASSGVAVAVMVVGFLGVGILPLIEAADGWEQVLPWYYLDGGQPALNGVDWQHVGLLGGASALFAAVGFVGVNRRDLRSKSTKRTMIDRLRDNPRTAKAAELIAG